MNDNNRTPEPTDKEYDPDIEQAASHWIWVLGVVGALLGYGLAAEFEFWLWAKIVLTIVGFFLFFILSYIYRRMIAMVGAVVVVVVVIYASIEGIRSA